MKVSSFYTHLRCHVLHTGSCSDVLHAYRGNNLIKAYEMSQLILPLPLEAQRSEKAQIGLVIEE